MGINDWLPTVLTLPSLAVAIWVMTRLLSVHRRVRAGSEDHLDVETARVFLAIGSMWVLTQGTVTLGLWLIPVMLGPQVLVDGHDRLTFDARSWLFVAISWLAGSGGLVLIRWLNRQLSVATPTARHP